MNLLDDFITIAADMLTLRVYDVTIIVERDGILVGKATRKRLMTLKEIERIISGKEKILP